MIYKVNNLAIPHSCHDWKILYQLYMIHSCKGYSRKNHNNPHHFMSQAFSEINLWFQFVGMEYVCHFKCIEEKRFYTDYTLNPPWRALLTLNYHINNLGILFLLHRCKNCIVFHDENYIIWGRYLWKLVIYKDKVHDALYY